VKAVVIGAGANGLAIAYLLARAGVRVHVVEKSPTPGGLLSTFSLGDCDRLEYFYHHFFTHDAEINWLLRELGLGDQIIFRETSMGVFRNGKLFSFNGPIDLLKFDPISLLSRLRFGISAAMLSNFSGYSNKHGVSCLDWFRSWAGHQATEAIWKPLLDSKFGSASNRIPLAWMAGRLRQRAKSRKFGKEKLGYLDGSLQRLVDTWLNALQQMGVEVTTGVGVESILINEDRVAGVITNGTPIESDVVVSTLPTPILSDLIRPINRSYADDLSSMTYLGAICTVLSLKHQLLPAYWTNVTEPGFSFGGIIEHTNFVSPTHYGNRHLVYLSRYLETTNSLWSMTDAEIQDLQLAELERITGRDIQSELDKCWVFRAKYAATLTDIGFAEKIPSVKSPLPGLFVASMCHIYPDERSVNNSIRVAAETVRVMGYPEIADTVPVGLSLSGSFGFLPMPRDREGAES
jgi:protoporphyrinogen oxidase